MLDKSKVIYGNEIDNKTYKKACKKKQKFIKKFGDDTKEIYHLAPESIEELSELGIQNLKLSKSDKPMEFDEKSVVIGNIRMGFGHYRISIAMASCAKSLGYTPYWFDLTNFDSTGSKMIAEQNRMYSMGSKLSQKFSLFNKVVWEPLNCEGFRKITYNSGDQKNSELLVPLFNDFPKDMPYVATHVWPSQGAIHADMTHVVNAIPDNWPMGLHLSEGAIHTVQTPFAYLGYKMLNGMAKNKLKPMPDDSLVEVGHYVDHELVSNIEKDCENRMRRLNNNEAMRFLLTVGGAGAGGDMYLSLIEHLIPYCKENKACVIINFGDHLDMYRYLCEKIKGFENMCVTYFDEYDKVKELSTKLENEKVNGIYCIYNKNIFEAVYSTNLLMRHVEVLVTKPSELAYYPVPKLMMKHIGGHERYGAIHASEYGDSTFECPTKEGLSSMADSLLNDHMLIKHMCDSIVKEKKAGIYDGGYEVIKLAINGKKSS